MRFYVALVDGLGTVLPLHNDVGLLKSLFHVAQAKLEVVGDVGALFGIAVTIGATRKAGLDSVRRRSCRMGAFLNHRVIGIEHRRQHLVIHINQGEGFFGEMRAGGRYSGDRMTTIEGLLPGKNIPAIKAVVDYCPLFLV